MSVQELRADAQELRALLEQATRPKVKDILSIAARKIETDIINRESTTKDENVVEETKQNEPKRVVTSSVPRRYTKDITTYAWDQSDKFMKIYITLSGVHNISRESVTSQFTKSSFRIRAEDLSGVDYSCAVADLWADINPDSSYIKVKTDTVLVMLRKVKDSETWGYVTHKEKKVKEKEKKKDDDDMDKDDPQAGMMKMMKKMYDDGDDEMKRTIAKAWSESQDKRAQGDIDS